MHSSDAGHRHYDRVAWVPERLSGTSEVRATPCDERAPRRRPVMPDLSAGVAPPVVGFVRQNRPQFFVASDRMAVSAIFDIHEF